MHPILLHNILSSWGLFLFDPQAQWLCPRGYPAQIHLRDGQPPGHHHRAWSYEIPDPLTSWLHLQQGYQQEPMLQLRP
jgi:hypothetical protein